MKSTQRGKIKVIALILVLVISFGAITFFVSDQISFGNNRILPADVCTYNRQGYLTCGKPYILVSQGLEISLEANKRFHFPEGKNALIVLVDETKPAGERGFLVFLQEGEFIINRENSNKALGSFIAKDFVE